MKKLENIDQKLLLLEDRHTRETKKKLCKKRRDQTFIHGYSTQPERGDLEHDEA
jgi:hypothetical protein